MIEIRYMEFKDEEFWFTLDKHLSKVEFKNKVRDKQGYILLEDGKPVGLLRYNLFWDNFPFCNMLFIDWDYQKKGYGRAIMEHWEKEMQSLGYGMIMTST